MRERPSAEQSQSPARPSRVHANPWFRGFLLCTGCLALASGVLGIFLPLLPTTPFLLLAAACFLRSSPAFYHWLVGHPRLGPFVNNYLDGKGMPRKAKVYTLVLLWSSIGFSLWWVPLLPVRLLLITIAFSVSLYILRLPVIDPYSNES
ncbi:YbaN family protein [Marinobacteraceae bacterium S3BR75-40.1]